MAEIDLPELLVPRETATVRRTTIGHLANDEVPGARSSLCEIGRQNFLPEKFSGQIHFRADRGPDSAGRMTGPFLFAAFIPALAALWGPR